MAATTKPRRGHRALEADIVDCRVSAAEIAAGHEQLLAAIAAHEAHDTHERRARVADAVAHISLAMRTLQTIIERRSE